MLMLIFNIIVNCKVLHLSSSGVEQGLKDVTEVLAPGSWEDSSEVINILPFLVVRHVLQLDTMLG